MNREETNKYWLSLDGESMDTIRWRFYGWTTDESWVEAPHETTMDCIPLLDSGYIALMDHMGTDIDIVNAARKSFGRESIYFDEGDARLLRYLWKKKHTTPFEMVELKFAVKAPLIVARQWMRHRTWSYNEVSRRYTEDKLDFYIPDPAWIRAQSEIDRQASVESGVDFDDQWIVHSQMDGHTKDDVQLYENILERGVCREQARLILPQSMYVEFVAKVDLWNLLHFLNLRLDSHAQWEMQQYAQAIAEILENVVPKTMEIFHA